MTTPVVGSKPRWPYFGRPQRRMLFAAFAIWAGVALPWFVLRPPGTTLTRYASPQAASWVLWAGLMTIAGAVVKWRLVAAFSALAGAGTAFVIAGWQMLNILGKCGFDLQLRCIPGPGVFVVQGVALFTLYQAYRVFRDA